MKIHLKFNHDAEDLLTSLDCPLTSDEVADEVTDVISEFMNDDRYQEKSHLAELMHNQLDYSIILFLALRNVTEDLEKTAMKQMLKRMLNDNEDI